MTSSTTSTTSGEAVVSSSRTTTSVSRKSVDFDLIGGRPRFLTGGAGLEDVTWGLRSSSVMDWVLSARIFFRPSFLMKVSRVSGESTSLTELSLEANGGENS